MHQQEDFTEVEAQPDFRCATFDDVAGILDLMQHTIKLEELFKELTTPGQIGACSTITPKKEFLLFHVEKTHWEVVKHVGKNYKIIEWLMTQLEKSSRTYIVWKIQETDTVRQQELVKLGFRATGVESQKNDVDLFVFEYHKIRQENKYK